MHLDCRGTLILAELLHIHWRKSVSKDRGMTAIRQPTRVNTKAKSVAVVSILEWKRRGEGTKCTVKEHITYFVSKGRKGARSF